MALFMEFVGGKPKVPEFVPVNAQDVQNQTISGNTSAIPATIEQTSALNAAQFANIDKMLAQASGGVYSKLRDKALANTMDLLNGGDITDVLRGTAAANLARGVAGSGFGRTTALQNSVNAVQANKLAGFSSLERWLSGANQTYQPISVGAMFARNTYDMPTALAHATEERNAKFQRDYVQNQWDWYDSPGQKLVRFEDTVVQLAGTIAGAAA